MNRRNGTSTPPPNRPVIVTYRELAPAVLLARVRSAPAARYLRINVSGLARWVRAQPTSISVRAMVAAAGVSRQHLARVFRPVIGVGPKRYCRLARFQAGLAYAGAGPNVNWAEAAADLGYADQSHMIAEFRELSGLSPDALGQGALVSSVHSGGALPKRRARAEAVSEAPHPGGRTGAGRPTRKRIG